MQLRELIRIILVTVILTALWMNRQALLELLVLSGNKEAVTTYLQEFGIWGPLLLISSLSVQVIFALIPGHILMIAGGYVYGFGGGLTLNLIGTVGASQLAFMAVRRVGRPLVNRLIPGHLLNRWNQVIERQGFVFFLLFFWFPVIPSNVMNFVASVSPISFWSFLAANFLGRLPGIILVTFIGSHGFELSLQQWVILIFMGVGLFVGGRYGAVRLQQRYLG